MTDGEKAKNKVYMFFVCILYSDKMNTLINIDGVPEAVLTSLLNKGYFKTKAEAIRAGILTLGEKHKILEEMREKELESVALKILREEAKMKAGGKKFETLEEVKKKYGFK